MPPASVEGVRRPSKADTPVLPGTVVVPAKAVAPTRLQLRWVSDPEGGTGYRCYYELVIALDENDIRRDQVGPRGGKRPDRAAVVVPLSDTGRSSSGRPCYLASDQGGEILAYDAPHRDGRHAEWDAGKLGGLPIYVVTVGGLYLQRA